jgi:hypothetical protein
LTWLARPLRANTLPHWSALVAHAPVSSKAFTSRGDSKAEPAAKAVATTSFRSTLIGFRSTPLSQTGTRPVADLEQRAYARKWIA